MVKTLKTHTDSVSVILIIYLIYIFLVYPLCINRRITEK